MPAQISIYEVNSSIERSVAKLMNKFCDNEMRAVIYSSVEERIISLNDLLWTLGKDSFIPHDFAESSYAAYNPILLTADIEKAKELLDTVILIDAENIEEFINIKERIIIFIHLDNPEVNELYKQLSNYPKKIWTEDINGRWHEKII